MDIVGQSLFEDVPKMRGFGAVAIRIGSLVLMFLHGLSKEPFGLLDFLGNHGEVGETQGGAEGFGQLHEIDIAEVQFVVQQFPTVLGETHTEVQKFCVALQVEAFWG